MTLFETLFQEEKETRQLGTVIGEYTETEREPAE